MERRGKQIEREEEEGRKRYKQRPGKQKQGKQTEIEGRKKVTNRTEKEAGKKKNESQRQIW